MIIQDLIKIWVCDRYEMVVDGETKTFHINPRSMDVNIQTDYTEIDLKEFGETVNEIIKIRTDTIPDIAKGCTIYLSEPAQSGEIVIGEETNPTYPRGNYTVISVKPTYIGGSHIINPTITTARIVT